MKFEDKTTYQEDYIGVPRGGQSLDLAVSPIGNSKQDSKSASNIPLQDSCSQKCVCPRSPSDAHLANRAASAGEPPEQPKLKGILKKSSGGAGDSAMATAGRTPPGQEDPSSKVPVPNELRPEPPAEALCYLPQPQDALPETQTGEMGPIGPWATGRLDWGPLAGLTGTRPVVDKYSITRYSEGEWRKHNKEMLEMADTEKHRADL